MELALIVKNGLTKATAKIEITDTRLNFKVDRVMSWVANNEIFETEPLLEGSIKWDGCSDVYYADEGYMHCCSKSDIELTNACLMALWEIASKEIEGWDGE